jgi:SAM-dependent methyltransferase
VNVVTPVALRARFNPLRWPLPALRWPLPALAGWLAAWSVFAALRPLSVPLAAALGTALGALFALRAATPVRRALLALGFPLSLAGAGAPAWAWLLPLAALAAAYPRSAWRDAPLFPTPAGALDGLADAAPLPAGARVLDAGCGLGHGLAALRRAYPQARLEGVEYSAPIAALAAWRVRGAPLHASVTRGDMWAADWRGCALVYLFQRPESLPRAVAKARRELADGAWLASLEFEAADLEPHAVLQDDGGRPLWLYRTPFIARADRAAGAAPAPRIPARADAASASDPPPAPCRRRRRR